MNAFVRMQPKPSPREEGIVLTTLLDEVVIPKSLAEGLFGQPVQVLLSQESITAGLPGDSTIRMNGEEVSPEAVVTKDIQTISVVSRRTQKG